MTRRRRDALLGVLATFGIAFTLWFALVMWALVLLSMTAGAP